MNNTNEQQNRIPLCFAGQEYLLITIDGKELLLDFGFCYRSENCSTLRKPRNGAFDTGPEYTNPNIYFNTANLSLVLVTDEEKVIIPWGSYKVRCLYMAKIIKTTLETPLPERKQWFLAPGLPRELLDDELIF